MTIFLNRHTGFNRSCRVRFNIRVAEGIESGIRDEVSDQDGKSLGKGQLISELGLNRTGHISVSPGQDRTPKFAGRVLPDRTKSGPIIFLVHTANIYTF